MGITVYREVHDVVEVASSDVLSRGRLRLYVQHVLGEAWKTSVAADVIWHDPANDKSRYAMEECEAKLLAEAVGVDVPTLVARAEAHWREHDARFLGRPW